VGLVQGLAVIQVPDGFTKGVMMRLPKPKKRLGTRFWLRQHPLLVAAAIFFVLMSASLLSGVTNSSEFSVTKNEGLVVEGSTVTVPADATIKGDIVVKNGSLVVDGKVEGN
ncbi:MAG: polymer-forming cytoskeletal protein, partial [Kurthia sp.]